MPSAQPFLLVLLCAQLAIGEEIAGRIKLTNSQINAVNRKGDCSGVAVWLKPIGTTLHPPVKRAVMRQKNKTFIPHILVIGAGSSVDFPNQDPIFHNAFSNYNGQIFDVSLYPPGSSRTVRFSRPGIVRVFCNIHPAMAAVIVVVDSPFFAITDHNGEFALSGLPPGSYELNFFHERATAETLAKLTRTINVSSKIDVGTIEISETGYLPMQHKNKYGKDYPPHSGDENYAIPQ